MKNRIQIIFIGGITLLFSFSVSNRASWEYVFGEYSLIGVPAFADEDEDEDEDDDDEDDDDDDDDRKSKGDSKKSSNTKTEMITSVRYEVRQVEQQVAVTPPEYLIDTDGDGLVDGVDPDPRVHQREYFMDDDDDGIANIFDRHPGEDDFSYYEGENDANKNGIIDSYESMENK